MPERETMTIRIEPTTLRRLVVLATRLGLSRTAVVHLAIAKLAMAEGVDGDVPR